MSSEQRPEQGHRRHVSTDSRRMAMPRRSTKGPLDIESDIPTVAQPPSGQPPTPALQTALPPSPAPGPASVASPASTVRSPTTSLLSPTIPDQIPRTRSVSPAPRMHLNLSSLLRPTLYTPVPPTGIAAPFLQPSQQSAPDTDLTTLLSERRFRQAAACAADELTSGSIPGGQTQRILELYHTRLACLVLSSQPDLAVKEAKPLSDILARESSLYTRPDRDVFVNQVPWDLRLLLLRLQTLASGDSRRGVMGLYALGSECRALAIRASNEGDQASVNMWGNRLYDLGVRIAGELVEMGEFETAKRHLATISTSDIIGDEKKHPMLLRQALLSLRIGDVDSARKCLSALPSSDSDIQQAVLAALISLSSADYPSALSQLQSLHSTHPTNDVVAHNLAVAHLYCGDVIRASEILESMVSDRNLVFPALLFNLATVYELRTERARERKLELVDKIAGMLPEDRQGVGSWERSASEFKLV